MRKLLIAHSSEELVTTLASMLSANFDITCCSDGNTASELLRTLRPDALILGLMLPYKDGLTALEDAAPCLPPVILALTCDRSCYIVNAAAAHGIGYVMMDSCETRAIVVRLMEMIACADLPPLELDEPQSETTSHLLRLGLSSEKDGFTQLRVGIPMYAQDSAQRLTKELYPAIAQLCGYGNGLQVERSIRSAIQIAWQTRDTNVWLSYFPQNTANADCPTNKVFISRLAAII